MPTKIHIHNNHIQIYITHVDIYNTHIHLHNTHIGEDAPLVKDLPTTMWMIEKWADMKSMGSVLLDICPCCELFVYPDPSPNTPWLGKKTKPVEPNDPNSPNVPVSTPAPLTHCPRPNCGAARSQERQMMVGGLVPQIQSMFESPLIAQVIYFLFLLSI